MPESVTEEIQIQKMTRTCAHAARVNQNLFFISFILKRRRREYLTSLFKMP